MFYLEFGWRIVLLEVLDYVDWGFNDLEKIRNWINVKWFFNINFDSNNMYDNYIKGFMKEELNKLFYKERIMYRDLFKLR